MKLAVQQQQQQQTAAAAAAYYAVSPAFAAATAAQSSANPVFYSPLMTPYAFQSRYVSDKSMFRVYLQVQGVAGSGTRLDKVKVGLSEIKLGLSGVIVGQTGVIVGLL